MKQNQKPDVPCFTLIGGNEWMAHHSFYSVPSRSGLHDLQTVPWGSPPFPKGACSFTPDISELCTTGRGFSSKSFPWHLHRNWVWWWLAYFQVRMHHTLLLKLKSQVKKQLLTLPWLRHFSWGCNDLFCHCLFFFFFKPFYFVLFIWLSWVLVEAWGIFSCSMWDLVPCPGIKPRPPALWAQSHNHGATREVPLSL